MKRNNGNRYVVDTDGVGGVFQRDIDKLYHQFANLRYSIYQQHAWKFDSEVKKEELKEYIDEQFVVLTKEYSVNSPVDFPGYIKKKLTLRVGRSYVQNKLSKDKDEFLGTKDNTVELLAESSNEGITDSELYDYVIGEGNFNDIQLSLLEKLISNNLRYEDSKIITMVANDYGLTRDEVREEFDELYDYVKFRCAKFYEMSKNRNLKAEGRVVTSNTDWD